MFDQSKKYPLEAMVDINSETTDRIINYSTSLSKSAISTYLNSPTCRPRLGDKVLYKNKEYFITWVYFIDGRTLLSFYKESNIFMGVHISQVHFVSRCEFASLRNN